MTEERRKRSTEAFFGRRHGKTLRPLQRSIHDDLLPRLQLDLSTPAPADIKSLFPEVVDGVRMEIGFGGGEHLHHEAGRFRNTGFIGVEPFVNSMAKLLADLHAEPIANMRLHNDDATQVLDWLPDSCLDGIDLFYPDPWPKKRHWKRRFVSPSNLDRFARVLKPGAKFRFASDIDSYINWTLLHCDRHPDFEWQVKSAADWRTPYEGWPGTRYEQKAYREGRRGTYLTFVRV